MHCVARETKDFNWISLSFTLTGKIERPLARVFALEPKLMNTAAANVKIWPAALISGCANE